MGTEFLHINSKDECNRTSLILTAIYGLAEAAKGILNFAGFDEANCKDNTTEQTALLWAAKCGHRGVVEAILANDQVDLLAVDRVGDDAYNIAMRYDHQDVAAIVDKQLEYA